MGHIQDLASLLHALLQEAVGSEQRCEGLPASSSGFLAWVSRDDGLVICVSLYLIISTCISLLRGLGSYNRPLTVLS